jgi:hypothetical protein
LASEPVPLLGDEPGVRVLSSDEILSFAWTLDDDGSWLKAYDRKDPLYKKFTGLIGARLDASPRGLIRRQRALFKKNGLSTAKLDWALAHPGRIRPMNKLQATLFLTHWRDENPQKREFQAFILRRGGRLRVYYTQSDENSAWPKSASVKALLAQDLGAGWTLFAHLHNHPFFFENPSGDFAGTVVPSEPDAQMYRELAAAMRLERAWIVNGFDAIDIPVTEFPNIPSDD